MIVKVLIKIISSTVLQQNTGKRLHFVRHCINSVMKNVELSKKVVFVQQKDSRTGYHLPKGIKEKYRQKERGKGILRTNHSKRR